MARTGDEVLARGLRRAAEMEEARAHRARAEEAWRGVEDAGLEGLRRAPAAGEWGQDVEMAGEEEEEEGGEEEEREEEGGRRWRRRRRGRGRRRRRRGGKREGASRVAAAAVDSGDGAARGGGRADGRGASAARGGALACGRRDTDGVPRILRRRGRRRPGVGGERGRAVRRAALAARGRRGGAAPPGGSRSGPRS